ncbi:uncharacterized protein N7498_004959 [Penicillium cinerascens]|uniref:Bromo domain-containing protein n=1 Tax=Penicillium cinerascens TaxID=70096 RepID=A0A9W9T042_9EURO|nr:uncharacterized protein N7498_004959 [Penicillium cinerascens]KAJ5204080.1 hypothetical protein N7498_004959 [Penicillium cinerascens]
MRTRGKRRKVTDDDLVNVEEPKRASSHPADEDEADGSSRSQGEEETEANFEGDSLQTAQDKIMSELARLKDADGDEVAYPFIGKPDRNLYRDYYEIIQHPVSLRSIQKKVRGTDSRKKSSKVTAYPTWQSFEEEVSYIWRNAREYNEDGSEISVLAGVLEQHFNRRVAEAKKHVPNPIQVDDHPETETPRIKLKMGARNPEPAASKLTLKMRGQTSETPSKDDGPRSGVTVDNESLKRQQDLVRAGSASQDVDVPQMSPRTRSLRRHMESPKSSAATTPSASEQLHSVPIHGRDPTGPIKDETSLAQSQNPETHSSHGLHEAHLDSAGGISSYDDANSALIRNVQIRTHPSLSLQHDLCLDIPPSSTLSQQTITVSLPSSCNLLRVRPTLAAGTAQRQVKIVALIGMQRLHPSGDASALAYDIQLDPGTTKVDLEAISGPARGVPKSGPPGSDVDYERVTVFFNLLR